MYEGRLGFRGLASIIGEVSHFLLKIVELLLLLVSFVKHLKAFVSPEGKGMLGLDVLPFLLDSLVQFGQLFFRSHHLELLDNQQSASQPDVLNHADSFLKHGLLEAKEVFNV